MAVQDPGIDEVFDAALSHYDAMTQIAELVADWGSAWWSAFNGQRFDLEHMRHNFYAARRNPYLMQFGENQCLDILRAAWLANAIEPGALLTLHGASGRESYIGRSPRAW
jgi:hypothetical protein